MAKKVSKNLPTVKKVKENVVVQLTLKYLGGGN